MLNQTSIIIIYTPYRRFSYMRNAFILFLTIFAGIGLISTSCINDAISSSPNDILSFSRDTVAFDTVFTDVGTPTARLVVANRAKKGINISSIRLRNPESNFSINVDGVSAKSFQNVEIWSEDSIYIFIECFMPRTEDNTPYRVEDELEFITNGVTQTVLLEAYGQNMVRLQNIRITEDTRFTADRPYVVFDSLVVEQGVTLHIEPATQLLFHDKAELIVHGTIEACGDVNKLIQMRGDRLDEVLPNIGYDILSGQWRGIRICRESFDNKMSYVDMRSTVNGLQLDSCGDLSRQKLTLTNSWLHNSEGRVFTAPYCKVDAYGVCFSEAANAVVCLTGGIYEFNQCTIANNYLFAAISEPMLSLYHLLDNDTRDPNNPNPLMVANFRNSIIYGIGTDINEGILDDSNVYIYNVSFKSPGEDDEHFIDCLWDCNPLFLTDRPAYYFNYRVRPDSPVVGAGNPLFVTPQTLTDIDGNNRLTVTADGNPLLGAYANPAEIEE